MSRRTANVSSFAVDRDAAGACAGLMQAPPFSIFLSGINLASPEEEGACDSAMPAPDARAARWDDSLSPRGPHEPPACLQRSRTKRKAAPSLGEADVDWQKQKRGAVQVEGTDVGNEVVELGQEVASADGHIEAQGNGGGGVWVFACKNEERDREEGDGDQGMRTAVAQRHETRHETGASSDQVQEQARRQGFDGHTHTRMAHECAGDCAGRLAHRTNIH